nr:hypothetical protein BHI3_23290 [Bacteriovorax sp. HI3]
MKTKIILATLLCTLVSTHAQAMGSKKPSPTPAPNPAPVTPTPAPSTKPTLDFGPELSEDAYLNAGAEVGAQVDDSQNDNELVGSQRQVINSDQVDQCFNDEAPHEYFADQISYYVQEMISDVPAKVGYIGSYYGTSSDDNAYFPTSLIRHPLCNVTSSTLSATMSKVPGQATIDKLNRFANTVNTLRQEVLSGDQSAKKELLSTWTRMFSCLAYAESLSTADTTTSKNVAAKVGPSGYRKPAGVKFYEDPAQDAASRLNIGMFQFTPNSAGNIQPCIRAWNSLNQNKASCQISQKATQADLIKALGSSYQSFNAFCGVHKLVQTFAIQVNTTKTSATHPSNVVNGKLKGFEQRCVSPHFQAGKAYNHFGPFQNSTGSNLDKLFTCIESSR